MRLLQLTIIASLALFSLAQANPEKPMPSPIMGGCLARALAERSEEQISRDQNRRSTVLVVRRRGSNRGFPGPGRSTTVDGKALYSNESTEVVVSMNLTQAEIAELLKSDTSIERIEPDQPMCVDLLNPDPDPEAGNGRSRRSFEPDEICWNIDRCDESGLPPFDGEYCPPVEGHGVDIYILDSGIRYTHQVFGGRASFGGYDEFGGQGEDNHGHGTHCAGLAVGRLTGVAWGARVYSIKVLDSNLAGFFSYVINGINHVIRRVRDTGRRSVISMSLIGPITPAVDDAIREAVANNIVVVTAAGNFRQDSCEYSPSSSPDVINVGAIQEAEDPDSSTPGHQLYWFNSQPNSPGSNYGRCVHILAPGQWIRSASHTNDIDRVSMSGTSMACPTVAGAVALLLQRYPNDTPRQIRDRLQQEAAQGIINMETFEGNFLPTEIAQETTNRLVYTGKSNDCIGTPAPSISPAPTTTTVTPLPTVILQGCIHEGVLYDHNTTILFNCSASCTCMNGRWDCQPSNCYDDICQSYSLGHFKTFDGTSYNVHGACEYVLAKPCNSDAFVISAVYKLSNGKAEINKVRVSALDLHIVLRSEEGKIAAKVNGNSLDRLDGNNVSIGEIKVEWIGSYPHVTFEDTGIDVFWDEAGSIQVSVSSNLRNSLCGMCGFYSGNSSDDFRKSDNTTATNITDFALSWLHGSRSNKNCDNPVPLNNTCSERRLRNSERVCGLINNPPFDACHSSVDPLPYIADCEFNFCQCKRNFRDGCACNVLANYARACAKAGVNVENWRDILPDCSAGCVGSRVYRECGSLCQLTCDNYQSPPFCSTDCTPTCVCPEGQVLKDGQCIETGSCFEETACGGTPLPEISPYYFERLYLRELEGFINGGLNLDRKRVPCHVNIYNDTHDLLFSVIFCLISDQEAPNYIVMHNASQADVLETAESLHDTHVLETLGCYFNEDDNYRCVVVFRPGNGSEDQSVHIRISYEEYQQSLLDQIERGFNVYQRKIYYDKVTGDLTVDVIFQRGVSVSVQDGITIQDLHQLTEENQQNGLYLADGNARLEGEEIIYSAVFTSELFGDCENRVYFNYDALQLFNLEQSIAPLCHIAVIIPTTGNITPLYTAVFWCQEPRQD